MSRLLFVALLAITLGCVASSSSNHLPAGLAMDLGPGVNLNERFFDQVRALIKRRLQEKGSRSRNSQSWQCH